MPNIQRRTLLGTVLAAPLVGRAHAAAGPIRMATWGGGVGKMWQQAFTTPFTQATGIPVTVTEVSAPEAQIRSDGEHPQYHMGIASIAEVLLLRKEGLIQDLDGVDIPGLKDIPAGILPRDADGKLIGVTPYYQYVGIALNTELAPASAFASWKGLADPKWKGKLAISRPAYSCTYDLVMLAIANGGDVRNIEPGLKDFAAYAGNAMTSYSSMAHMNQLLLRGEIAGGSYYSSRIWEMRRQGNLNMQLVIPKEGVWPQTYAVVVPKNVPMTPELAKWVAYIATPEPQLRAYEISGYNPASSAAKLDPGRTRAELGLTLEELRARIVSIDWAVIAAEQRNRTALTEKIFAESK